MLPPSWLTRPIARFEYLVGMLVVLAIEAPIVAITTRTLARSTGSSLADPNPWAELYLWDPRPWILILLVSAPCLVLGAALTTRRLVDAKVRPEWALLFALPLLAPLVVAPALVLPTRASAPVSRAPDPYREGSGDTPAPVEPTLAMRLLPRTVNAAFWLSCLASVSIACAVDLVMSDTWLWLGMLGLVPVLAGAVVAAAVTYAKDTPTLRAAGYVGQALAIWGTVMLMVDEQRITSLLIGGFWLLPMSAIGTALGIVIGREGATHR